MKLFKRGKIWWGRWSVNGEPKRVSSGTSDERLAKEFLAKAYATSFRIKQLNEKVNRTWHEAADRYLSEHRHLKSYGSYAYHRLWWDKQFKEHGITYVHEITPDAVKEIRELELARPKVRGGGKRSAGDVNRKIAFLRAVVNAVYREYRWVEGEAPLFRSAHGEKERLRYLKPDEVMRLAKALPEGYSDMALMAVATGLRRRNILRMRWDQIDFSTRLIRVDGVLMKNGDTLVVPLNQMAMEVLGRLKDNGSSWVFPLKEGRPLKEVSSKVWSKALQRAGLENLRWHDLRHTWASILRQNGVPKDVLKEMGGWKDARMVDRYAHLDVSHLTSHAGVLDRAFAGGMESKLRAVG